jgi:hypothetical protein
MLVYDSYEYFESWRARESPPLLFDSFTIGLPFRPDIFWPGYVLPYRVAVTLRRYDDFSSPLFKFTSGL